MFKDKRKNYWADFLAKFVPEWYNMINNMRIMKGAFMIIYLLSVADESDHDKILYVYHQFHTDMIKIAKSRLKAGNHPDYYHAAMDAVQAALYKITKYINRIDFNVSERELRTYVTTIVVNESVNLLYDNKRVEEITEVISDEDFLERIHIVERYQQVVSAIQALDDRYSSVMMCYYCEEKSVKYIAKMMGLPVKTIYTRLERGKQLLLQRLEEGDNAYV